jgi:N-acetylglucosaminyl-diphospho-decaprenol L-rhamnosyltransferase
MTAEAGQGEPLPVTAIIVHYKTEQHLVACLDDLAVRPDRPREITVVDNASLGDPDRWRARYPDAQWVFFGENRGYAAGVNAGAVRATSTLLLILNPDARPDPGSLRTLVAFMTEHREVGAVTPRLVSPDGAPQNAGGSLPTFRSLAGDKFAKIYGTGPGDSSLVSPVAMDWISATVMLCRRTAFNAVGGMDEGFFLYYEDCDLGLRLREKRWYSYILPAARAVHFGGASFRGDRRTQLDSYHASEDRYFRMHRPKWEGLALRLVRRVYDALGLRNALYSNSSGRPASR